MLTDDVLAGSLVRTVQDSGFAADAGIRPGDVILKLGTAPVFSRTDLWMFTREHGIGEDVDVAFARDGEVITARAALSEPM
nr:PDZ domain-containing protein [Kibdelosporangium phytohabitans]